MKTVKCRFSPVLKKSTTYSPPPKAAHALERGVGHCCKLLKGFCQGNTDLLEIPACAGKGNRFIFMNRKQKIGNVTFPLRRQGSQVLQRNLQKIVEFTVMRFGLCFADLAPLKLCESEGVFLKNPGFFKTGPNQHINKLKT